MAGRTVASHTPSDRRTLLPITPVHRPAAAARSCTGTPGGVPRALRSRLDDSPVATLKIASGCDRRCSFCAIPSFRGSFVSRTRDEVLAEGRWLAARGSGAGAGQRELDVLRQGLRARTRALESCCPAGRDRRNRTGPGDLLAAGRDSARLLETIATTPGVAPYFDLSFQHASRLVLRRMRRFGGRGLPRPARTHPRSRHAPARAAT